MYQYRGLNWDNQDAASKMAFSFQTKFIGLDEARNLRVRKVWLNCGTLWSQPVPIYTLLDSRTKIADATSDEYVQKGETKTLIGTITISAQDSISSRGIPRHANSKGQNCSFFVSENRRDFDLEVYSIEVSIIQKNQKKNYRVGV